MKAIDGNMNEFEEILLEIFECKNVWGGELDATLSGFARLDFLELLVHACMKIEEFYQKKK